MQGESDAHVSASRKYKNNLLRFTRAVRADLEDYICDNGMYFVDAYISSSSYWSEYKTINKAKQTVCNRNKLNVCVDTIKEGLTFDKEPAVEPDLAHYDSLSEIKLGHLFVQSFSEIYSIS